jgi:hypothetical protein
VKSPLSLSAPAMLGAFAFAVALGAAGCGGAAQEATAAMAQDAPAAPVSGSHELEPVDHAAGPAGDAQVGHEPHADAAGALAFTGTREETERLIRYYRTIRLTPGQEHIKVEALAAIPAPCCDDNPLATCCCPCNMAKAAWGLAAWLIVDHEQGVEGVRQATLDWLSAANPGGFAGNACYTPGGCARPIHRDGCGGMDERRVL